jgi:hypothetical protein
VKQNPRGSQSAGIDDTAISELNNTMSQEFMIMAGVADDSAALKVIEFCMGLSKRRRTAGKTPRLGRRNRAPEQRASRLLGAS